MTVPRMPGVGRKKAKLKDAIFIITQEKTCPLYNVGEEIKVANGSISISSYKPVCLYLSKKSIEIASTPEGFGGGISPIRSKRARFDCGGCGDSNLIHFEYKQEKDFATLQMKMLSEAEAQRRRQHLERYFGMLRTMEVFESLDDDALRDLTLMLEFKTIPVDKVVVKKGEPGNHLNIILKGKLGLLADDGTRIAEMGSGEIFGEMSLLTGDPVSNSIHTLDPTQIAMLSLKNFKYVIVKYPVLQLFLFKMLVARAQAMALKEGNISSGMTGELEEIAAVDLFQLINSSQKTGTITLSLARGQAHIYFFEGQIVFARYLQMKGKEAVYALLNANKGFFSYAKGIPHQLDGRPPLGDFMGMLMEGLQRIDEVDGDMGED
ncbi:DUF4388 domain-containing protein [Desulfopila sp. IMCC35008]|uniref:DUF4388 domain-containing protein n=1 Tax=Desulfopila sp. IMCC35008 TaxID=2653858 RepID=UPI001F117EF7|nr:DUF4388 domain-containing protein [Desulfopila sp. IMCC35008]